MIWAVSWFILALTFTFLVGRLNWPRYYRLAHEGTQTTGTVIGKESHRGISYTFTVNGLKYGGTGTADYIHSDFESLKSGDVVEVYYLPFSPTVSCAGDPWKLYWNETQTLLLGSVILPAFALAMFRIRYDKVFWGGKLANSSFATRLKL